MAGVPAISSLDPHHCSRAGNVDLLPLSSLSIKVGEGTCMVGSRRRRVELSRVFFGSWGGKGMRMVGQRRNQKRSRAGLVVVNEIAGNYEEGFNDVDSQLINYFTYKAVRTVLHQLYELNPPSYMWFYNFVATSDTSNGRNFLRKLVKEKQDLAERVMVTRLHLYAKWIKKCDHAKMYQNISNENLELMRERLIETVVWPSEDTNTETIG